MSNKFSKSDGDCPRVCVEWQKPAVDERDDFAIAFWNLLTLAIAMILFVTLLNDRDQKRLEYELPTAGQQFHGTR